VLSLLGEDYHIIHIKFNLFNEMSAYDHYPTDKAYSSDSRVTNISKSFTRKMAAKPVGIDMKRNYVTVTLCMALTRVQLFF